MKMEKRKSLNCDKEEQDICGSISLSIKEEMHELNSLNDVKSSSPCNTDADEIFFHRKKYEENTPTLSFIYAEILLVIIGTAISSEILQKSLPSFYVHEYIFTYLYGIGIFLFIGIYSVSLRCRSSFASKESNSKIIQEETCDINKYLKIGAIVFGVVALLISMLEFISIFMSPTKCLNLLSASQPLLCCIFVFFQLFFLRNIKAFNILGCCKSFAFMHLFAVNVAIWLRLILWESAKDWEEISHIKHNSSLPFEKNEFNFTLHSLESDIHAANAMKHSPEHVVYYTSVCFWQVQKSKEKDLISIQYCLRNSTIGSFWEKTDQLLYPLKIQYYFVIASILYIIWNKCHTKPNRPDYSFSQFTFKNGELCMHSTKGLFLGTVILVISVIVAILLFVMERDRNLILSILYIVIFVLSSVAAVLGSFQVRKMCTWKSAKDMYLIKLFQNLGLLTIFVYGSCKIFFTLSTDKTNLIVAFEAICMIFQATTQYLFIICVSRKIVDVSNDQEKPGRQVVIFIILCNISLWILDCFVTWNHVRYYHKFTLGEKYLPIMTRCILPFIVYYRYHSIVTLSEVWLNAYRRVKI